MSAQTASPPRPPANTLQIVSIVSLTFIGYLCIGLPLAVLPGFVHQTLGQSPVVAGAVISIQYLATLLSRALAGRLADTLGPKRTVQRGLIGSAAAGALLLLAFIFAH